MVTQENASATAQRWDLGGRLSWQEKDPINRNEVNSEKIIKDVVISLCYTGLVCSTSRIWFNGEYIHRIFFGLKTMYNVGPIM